jgi:hypothetical protein
MNEPMPGPRATALFGGLATLAMLLLHGYRAVRPVLWADDFGNLACSWTWGSTVENLWAPSNEHFMPLGRLTTWALIQLDPDVVTLPLRASLHGPLAVAAGMWLAYLFVARETGRRLAGLAAMLVFGVTLRYHEAVSWFSASFALLAADTILLALLSAQRWRQTGSRLHLALCLLWVVLAPTWFASGVLAGPLCGLYLLPQDSAGWAGWRGRLAATAPVLAGALYLAVALPLTGRHINHLPHYGGQTAVEAFSPRVGALYTARAIVDSVLLNQIGVLNWASPRWLVAILLPACAGLTWWWCRLASPRLVLLGLGLIFLTYLLTYSARAGWPYHQIVSWSRYNAIPMLGVALLVAAGLAARAEPVPQDGLSRRQVRGLAAALTILVLVQLPAALVMQIRDTAETFPQQQAVLRRVREVDGRCRQYGIGADAAREVLPPLEMPGHGAAPAWIWLRGSEAPVARPPDEVRRLLEG